MPTLECTFHLSWTLRRKKKLEIRVLFEKIGEEDTKVCVFAEWRYALWSSGLAHRVALKGSYWRFGGSCCLRIQGIKLRQQVQNTRCNIREDHDSCKAKDVEENRNRIGERHWDVINTVSWGKEKSNMKRKNCVEIKGSGHRHWWAGFSVRLCKICCVLILKQRSGSGYIV